MRRSRRLVVSSIATVGNYEYGFYWYFYLDGTIQLEVKLTGIMSTMAVADGDAGDARHGWSRRAWPRRYHQHLFNVRLDVEVDGADNAVFEVDAVPPPPGQRRTRGATPSAPTATLLETELAARRDVDPSRSRTWRIVNRAARNGLGEPTAYKLLPGATPTLLADPESSVGRRAAFAAHNLWVTPFDPDERRAAGDYPNQHAGGAGLPAWTAHGPLRGRHRHRALALLRGHPRPAARGLAGHAGRVHRLHADPVRLLRSQPGPRRAALGRALRWLSTGPTAHPPQEYHPPVEEYLETMLALAEEGVPVIQARIAERLGRSAPSVSEMLDRLIEDGYVTREGRRLSLTDSGRALAEKVVRKHRLAERLLVDVIGLEWHKVHREAGRWEHVISDDVEARLVELLGDPATCPTATRSRGRTRRRRRSRPSRSPRWARASGCASSASARRSSSTWVR